MPTPAEEHRRRLNAARAAEIPGRRYRPPAKQAKGNRDFARKDKGEVRRG